MPHLRLGKKFAIVQGYCESVVQKLWISFQLYGKNSLANHAAAGAYSFLLAAVPALLMVAFILSGLFQSSPEKAAQLIIQIDFLEDVFDIKGLVENFLAQSHIGTKGFVFVISTFWSALLFAPSLQRGLTVIFCADSGKPNLLRNSISILVLELSVIAFAFIMVFNSQTVLFVQKILAPLPFNPDSVAAVIKESVPYLSLGLFSFIAYRTVPSSPRRAALIFGALTSVVLFTLTSFAFQFLLNTARYHALYGSLAGLIILLVNVYFFFVFFFFGAEVSFVIEAFDAFLFVKMRKHYGQKKSYGIEQMIFASAENHLHKYRRSYPQGSAVFLKGDSSHEVYYILSGKAGIYLSSTEPFKNRITTIMPHNFFGEMGHVLSQRRSATVKAETDLTVMVLPPALFKRILQIDLDTDDKVIKTLSKHLKDANERSENAVESPAG
ncbi:MAG: YihY/virulence factor BrkB family protein [Spirochaetaceae bacterium]|jgi:membrane protein|nr:YihY/virulence factor BrkB family protein [Spirochaetaceae bacterium]